MQIDTVFVHLMHRCLIMCPGFAHMYTLHSSEQIAHFPVYPSYTGRMTTHYILIHIAGMYR